LFADISERVADITVFENGFAYLINEKNQIIFHPEGETEFPIDNLEKWNSFIDDTADDKEGKYVFEYSNNGKKHKLAYYEMENHMKLLLTAPTSEIDAENNILARDVMGSVVIISVICIFISILISQSIIRPLKELTKVSKQIADGNMKVTLPTSSKDEVGVLADSLQQMVDCLSVYMDRISDLAYTDALTGVKSKTAYIEEIRKIEQNLQEGFNQFGLVFFDLNGLKNMNDTYGHDAGDAYIKNACRLICTTYKHSPVFRIGGDEFAAILTGQDLLNSGKLMRRFYERMEIINRDAQRPYEKVSVAAGMAVFKEGIDTDFQSVFKRADDNMYKNKTAIKSGKGPILEVEKFEI